MSNISNSAITAVLAAFAQLATPTLPTFYLALCSATPTAGLTGATITELTNAGGYARQAITFAAPSGGPPTTSSNSNAIAFAVSTAAYSATATAYAICDSATIGAGALWYFNTLGSSVTVNAANLQVRFAIGALTVGLS